MDAELLEILVCPETHQPLRLAEEAFLSRLNEKIAAGSVTNLGGDPVAVPLEEGLIREDGRRLYPVRDGIPVVLIDEAIETESLS